jgi:hypothetical protein
MDRRPCRGSSTVKLKESSKDVVSAAVPLILRLGQVKRRLSADSQRRGLELDFPELKGRDRIPDAKARG